MVVIAVFYTDPAHPIEPKYLGLVFLAMFLAYCLRKFHFRKERATHQSWFLYVAVGFISWLGLLWAHMHPALALVPVVPFMPGPTYKALDNLDEEVEVAMETLALAGGDDSEEAEGVGSLAQPCRIGFSPTTGMTPRSKAVHTHHEFSRGRGVSIQGTLMSASSVAPWL
jgi:hypothetical protein